MRAKFEFTDVPPELPSNSIVIRDSGGMTTITSDAAAVIQTLLRIAARMGDEIAPNQPPIHYYDSVGRLGQLYHDGANFTAFSGSIVVEEVATDG